SVYPAQKLWSPPVLVPVPGTAVSFCTDSVNFSRDKIVQIIEALLPEWGTSRVLFTKWWSTGYIC
ncbi:hypothetical protein D9J32_25070, partial [Escherichia coli]|nr:hypothetical protein [Escherichia coli]